MCVKLFFNIFSIDYVITLLIVYLQTAHYICIRPSVTLFGLFALTHSIDL